MRQKQIIARSALVSAVAVMLIGPATVEAQPQVDTLAEATKSIDMQVGETRLMQLSEKVIRVSVANPEIADVMVVTPLQVLVTAKSVGSTHLILWSTADQPLVISVECSRNLDQLRNQYKKLFPDDAIDVGSVGDLVVISGQVSDLRTPARAGELAKLYAERYANLIEVTGDQQVQLEVRFAEVSRSALRQMGLNFLWSDVARSYVGGTANAHTQTGRYLDGSNNLWIPGTGTVGSPLVPSPSFGNAFDLFFSTGLEQFPFSAILSILSQEGLAKILAEPTLVALSGQEAEFHAGGEIPILIARQLGEVSVEYKKFGVRLRFQPTVLGHKTMSLKLAVEVSEPDPNSGVALGGYQVPGFRTRSSETTVRIEDGQSFAVAGLLSESVRSTVAKVPLLGDLPVLGILFRSKAYQREETELMVVVRAFLVRPQKPGEMPLLPGENQYTHPSDFRIFMTTQLAGPEMKNDDRSREPVGSPSGPIGFEPEQKN